MQQDPSPDIHEGLGVGLFLARRVMRLHGGDLVYQDRPGGGSIFTFRFAPVQPN
jgi:Signal transduction histidine kinase